MNQPNTILITEYLSRKNIPFKEQNGELITSCLFGECDADSRQGEAHLYFDMETSQYHCKKCDAKGNIFTLAEFFGDDKQSIFKRTPGRRKTNPKGKIGIITLEIVEKCHHQLPEKIRAYLHERGISDLMIDEYKLGLGNFYGKSWITIPVKNADGEYVSLRLRKYPEDEKNPDKFKTFPVGSGSHLYGAELLLNAEEIYLCEGEMDALLLRAHGFTAVSSTAGAGTFKDEWLSLFCKTKKLYVCYDKDDVGREGAKKVIEKLSVKFPRLPIYQVSFPERMTKGKDITDYFTKYGGSIEEFRNRLSKRVAGKKPIDIAEFKPIKSGELEKVLGLTIKKDTENKIITFLCCLSAFTENSQFNVSFNSPSSSGKSYIPLEIAQLFPKEDVIELSYCSPSAFFHEQGKYDKETNTITVDLSRKIIIFLDQPTPILLERLRSLLSHDKKEMRAKIADKSQRGGNRTKTVILRGYPAVIFCSAGLKVDEQEATRFFLLSPDITQEKLRMAVLEKILKDTDSKAYQKQLSENPERKLLMRRIEAIREECIEDIKIPQSELVQEIFLNNRGILKPRDQRDVSRFMAFIKMFALLNVWSREREENTLIAQEEDIKEAVCLWEKISESQQYNLPPYIYNIYQEVLVPLWKEKRSDADFIGLSRRQIVQKYFAVYGRPLADWQLRANIIPMLETAGLIFQEPDPSDKRKALVVLDMPQTNRSEQKK